MRFFSPVVLAAALAGCATQVMMGDEPSTLNKPDDLVVCPAGTEKRVAARTMRELNLELFGEEFAEKGEGFIPARMLAPPRLKYPGGFLGRKPGFVSLVVVVSPEGQISNPFVVCSSGLEFERVAVSSIATAVIEPATQDGVSVETAALIPVKFELR
jgi:hypothetical protein